MAAAGVVQPGSLLSGGNGEPKGQLVHFAQRACQRQITKEDIVYTSAKYGDVYQVTVTLNCMEGQQFVGETATKPKEAEKNAAIQALIHFQPMADNLPAAASKNKKRKADTSFPDPAAKAAKMADGDASRTAKNMLNVICMQLLRKPMMKTDIVYECNQTPVGFQATVKLPCLPGEFGELAWAGEPATQTKIAEQNAAQQALDAVNAQLESIKAMLPPPPVKPQRPMPNKGKGKGKGKGKFGKGGGPMGMGGMGGMQGLQGMGGMGMMNTMFNLPMGGMLA